MSNSLRSRYSLADWQVWLEQTHPKNIELGLDRVALVAKRLRLSPIDVDTEPEVLSESSFTTKQIADKVVVVAGTNGKGSCIAALEQLAVDAGLRVGVYTSPHFLRYNERFRVNRVAANDDEICAALDKVERARGEIELTYFEFSTLAALELFSCARLDVAILEVGLGGRLDAVNIVRADIALMTRVDLDHQDWLGETREQIGAEKAGILRDGIVFVCADIAPPANVIEAASLKGTQRYFIGNDFAVLPHANGGFALRTHAGNSYKLPDIGLHPASLAAAVQTAELLGLELRPETVTASLRQVVLPGRQQLLSLADQAVILDVAHNPSAVGHLRNALSDGQRCYCESGTVAVFAVMKDKDWTEMVDIIHDVIDHWFLAELPGNERAETPQELAAYLLNSGKAHSVQCVGDVAAALDLAVSTTQQINAAAPAQILVFGSFFTVAAAMEYLADQQYG